MESDPAGVLITGGSRGLGRAIAERLADRGRPVGLIARTARELEQTVDSIKDFGGRAFAFPCDVLDAERLRAAVEEFEHRAGRLDALVCAAGQLKGIGPMAAAAPDVWWRDLETSVRGVQLSIREALPALRRSGSASVLVLVGPGHNLDLPFASGYAAGQAALVRLVESLGRELSQEQVFTCAVNPGLVPTDLVRGLIDSEEGRRWLPQFNEAFAEGKEVDPGVAAEMVEWLIDRRPPELTGRVVPAPLTPTILETRLERIRAENLHVLRLR